MQKEDWARVARMIGYVYIPIVILIVFIFVLVQYQSSQIERERQSIPKDISPVSVTKIPQ